MTDWPQPTTLKHVERIMGFVNVYCHFNFSSTAAPINAFTSKCADHAFSELKRCFTSVPVLPHLDQSLSFTVELDVSDVGNGDILSQRSTSEKKKKDCARCHIPAETNNDIGNCKFLAVKDTLEEWRHWLEGAKHPFVGYVAP